MTLFSRLFGGVKKVPEDLATLQEAGAALEALRQERADVRPALDELVHKRRTALLADESDKHIQALDAEHDRLLLLQERLDAAEPRILARIGELQGKQRRELFESMMVILREREAALDAAMAAVVDAFGGYQTIAEQFESAGFSQQARSVIIPPPALANGGVIASAATVENWRRMREAVADRQAVHESRKVHQLPQASGPYKAAKFVPPFSIYPKIAPPPAPAAAALQSEYRPKPSRPPIRQEGDVPFGFAKIVILRSGLPVANEPRVAGDELILSNDDADAALRTGGAEIVERGTINAEAAQ